MSKFSRTLRIIGRALRRGLFAIGRFFKFTGKKISKASKTSRLNKRIAKNEKVIDQLFSEIGRNYYEAHAKDPEEFLSELCSDVGENKTFIEESQAQIAALQKAYDEAKLAAKKKARDRRAADKAAAREDKMAGMDAAEEISDVVSDVPEAEPDSPAPVTAPFENVEPFPSASSPEVTDVPAEAEVREDPEDYVPAAVKGSLPVEWAAPGESVSEAESVSEEPSAEEAAAEAGETAPSVEEAAEGVVAAGPDQGEEDETLAPAEEVTAQDE